MAHPEHSVVVEGHTILMTRSTARRIIAAYPSLVIPGCSVSGVARAASQWLIEHSSELSPDAARCRVILFELEAADHSDDGER